MTASGQSSTGPAITLATRAGLLGLCLAVVAIAALHWPLENQRAVGLSLFLALTACVYPGALLAQNARRAVAAAEFAIGAAVFACAWLGLAYGALWLAAGYAVHAAWDWLHHVRLVSIEVAAWFPPGCAIFDIALTVYAVSIA